MLLDLSFFCLMRLLSFCELILTHDELRVEVLDLTAHSFNFVLLGIHCSLALGQLISKEMNLRLILLVSIWTDLFNQELKLLIELFLILILLIKLVLKVIDHINERHVLNGQVIIVLDFIVFDIVDYNFRIVITFLHLFLVLFLRRFLISWNRFVHSIFELVPLGILER